MRELLSTLAVIFRAIPESTVIVTPDSHAGHAVL